jgi:hypothetical protein
MYFVWVRFRACFGFISQRATLAHVINIAAKALECMEDAMHLCNEVKNKAEGHYMVIA